MAAESRGCRPNAYTLRHPEQTVLYRIVQQHLESYLLLSREGDWRGHAVPAYLARPINLETAIKPQISQISADFSIGCQ